VPYKTAHEWAAAKAPWVSDVSQQVCLFVMAVMGPLGWLLLTSRQVSEMLFHIIVHIIIYLQPALPIVQEGVENTHYLMINHSKPILLRHILVGNGQKPVRLRP
jgi:hypothetical protein